VTGQLSVRSDDDDNDKLISSLSFHHYMNIIKSEDCRDAIQESAVMGVMRYFCNALF